MADADRAGQGSSPFRAFLRALPDDIAAAADAGLPVVLERDAPLAPHARRLMDALGVEVRIVTQTAGAGRDRALRGARTEGHYVTTYSERQAGAGPRADWIDYRASVARVHKRDQNGDEALTCLDCGTETDVTDVVHSPNCPVVAAAQPKRADQWTPAQALEALRAYGREHGGLAPRQGDWSKSDTDRPSAAVVVQLFGSWADACTAAGVEMRKRGPASAAQIRRAEQRDGLEEDSSDERAADPTAEEGPCSPTPSVGRADEEQPPMGARTAEATDAAGEPGPGPAPDRDHSDLLEDHMTVLEEPPARKRRYIKWDRDSALASVRRVAGELGRAPMQRETATYSLPSASTARELFGCWADMIETAGLPRPKRGSAPTAIGEDLPPRQQPPVVWVVKVPGTGLRYRTADEAYVAADEIEHDGERVAREARVNGQEGKADQAIDASRELAEKIRATARAVGAVPEPVSAEDATTQQAVPDEPPEPREAPPESSSYGLLELAAAGELAHAARSAFGALTGAQRRAAWQLVKPLIEAALVD